MVAERYTPTTSTHPGGISGANYATGVDESVAALWTSTAGRLKSVAGTNIVTANVQHGTLTAYVEPLTCVFKPVATNTGVMTLNLNGLGAKSIVKLDGSSLSAGEIINSRYYLLAFMQTENHFVVIAGIEESVIASERKIHGVWSVNVATVSYTNQSTTKVLFTSPSITGTSGDIIEFIPDARCGPGKTSSGPPPGLWNLAMVNAGTIASPWDIDWYRDGSLYANAVEMTLDVTGSAVWEDSAITYKNVLNGSPWKIPVPDSSPHTYGLRVTPNSSATWTSTCIGRLMHYTPETVITS